MSRNLDLTFSIVILLYAVQLAVLYHKSPLNKRFSFWMGIAFMATACIGTGACFMASSLAALPGLSQAELAATLVLASHAQSYLVVVGLIGGGVGGNLVAHALTSPPPQTI